MKLVLLILSLNLAFCWIKFAIPNTDLLRAHHAAVTYQTWSQTDANSLCSGTDVCGPYCNYTSSACSSTYYRNLTNVPAPSGVTTGLNNTETGCPDDCCSTENCLRTLNNNGNPVPINQPMLLIFGGKLYPTRTPGQPFVDPCEEEAQALSISGSCEGTLSNSIWIYAIDSNMWLPVVPSTNNGYTIPPARYGHQSVQVSIAMTDPVTSDNYVRKYMYVYGGYSSSGCSGFCGDFWRYDIPWAPQRYYPESESYWNRGNVWEQITTTTSPGNRAFFGMTYDGSDKIYLFGGVVQLANGTNTFANDLWVFDVNLGTWEELTTSGIASIERNYVLWNGVTQSQSLSFKTLPQSGDILINKTITTGNICNSNAGVLIPDCQAFLSLVYSNNVLYFYSGYSATSQPLTVPSF